MSLFATPLTNLLGFVAAVSEALATEPLVAVSTACIALGVPLGLTGLAMSFNDWRAERRRARRHERHLGSGHPWRVKSSR